jgi:hypothetical protein
MPDMLIKLYDLDEDWSFIPGHLQKLGKNCRPHLVCLKKFNKQGQKSLLCPPFEL